MRTQNEWGPQTKIEKRDTSNKSVDIKDPNSIATSGVEERISNIENQLNIIKPISKDIYSRLKRIEDKLLEIESISPEYARYWVCIISIISNRFN